MRESDVVEVLREGHQGWWYVRHLANETEGWVPAGYLEPAKRRSTISSNSMNSMHSSHSLHTSQSSGSFGKVRVCFFLEIKFSRFHMQLVLQNCFGSQIFKLFSRKYSK